MKIGEAQKIYRQQRQSLIEQRNSLVKQRDELLKKGEKNESERELFSKEAAILELSINETTKEFDKNQEILDTLTEQYVAVWNAEVARQQNDVLSKAAVDVAKIMEVARRIAKGASVPSKDEQKLMDYSMELYMSAKNMAVLNTSNKKEKYDSLWDDEEEEQTEYDPEGKAENAEVSIDLPEISS